MLGSAKIMGFVPSSDLQKAKKFYEGVLGLALVSEDPFALVLEANGIQVRIAKVEELTPQPFTILGWEVSKIEETVSRLRDRGVHFKRYPKMEQDDLGIWKSPSGARVAWFTDTEGNVLSVTQFARGEKRLASKRPNSGLQEAAVDVRPRKNRRP
jgi:predicted enzyme related to lactoylglutathione lyase